MRYLEKVNIKVWLPFNTLALFIALFHYFAKPQGKEAEDLFFDWRSQK